MKILLTNDDGIDAPGLAALYDAIETNFGDLVELVVVAPDRGRSECGHSVTTGRPLKVIEQRPGWFSVDGTPVDCVRATTSTISPKIHAAISGINAGANLGVDLMVSGTFAAAREASIQGLPAIAVSHYRRPEIAKTWDHVGAWLNETLGEFLALAADFSNGPNVAQQRSPEPPLWNVNLPATNPIESEPPRVWCDVDRSPMTRTGQMVGQELSMQSEFHGRPRRPGSDVDRCFAGAITVSRLTPWSI